MGKLAVNPTPVMTAIATDPSILKDAPARNPALTATLAEAQGVLKEYTEGNLKKALDTLPEASPHTGRRIKTTPSATTETSKTSLEIAEEMVKSYSFGKENRTATFTVPAGVTDVGAMKAINEYFRKNLPGLGRDAIDPRELGWLENLPKEFPEHCQKRDYSKARHITIEGVVKGTKNERWLDQADVLKQRSLVISDPRDQFIAAALHACNHRGADLFQGLAVRCSVPGAMVSNLLENGVSVVKFGISGEAMNFIAASGSPRKLK